MGVMMEYKECEW